MTSPLPTAVAALLAQATSFIERHPRRITAVVAAILLGGTGATFAVANLAPDASDLPVRALVQDVSPVALAAQVEALDLHQINLYRSNTTRSTDTVDTLFKRLGVFDAPAAAFMRNDTLVQKLLMGRNGRNVTIEADQDNQLIRLQARWSPDDDGTFKRLTVEKSAQGFRSRVETLPLTASSRLGSGTIRSSLYAATDESRIPDSVASQLAEIFSGDIDFHRALRKGDQFSVVYETLEGDGEPLRAGRVLSAEFVNAGKTYQAMWFQDPALAGTSAVAAAKPAVKGGYYNLKGESLRRAFLASPLEFSRVTSGFAMRFHPILRTWRAHLGVDYGAPTGTAVRTVGDGIVDFAGVQNGFGNVVIVKHSGSQSTVYAHLSKINVRKGQSVSQGQNIGAVGATGWATGPHLHYEFRVNGEHRDPLTIARQSESTPVTAAARPAFERAAAQVRLQLQSVAQMQTAGIE